ncbi:MAG: YceI family protein [Anaerolineae bacterium]|nr:YceI family protein [Anaerolineae bacterium]
MNSNRTLMGGLILAGIGVVVIGAIWYFVLRTPEGASEPIAAIPLELPTNTATPLPEPTAEPTAVPPTNTPQPEATEAAPEPTAVPPTDTPEPTADSGVLRVYEISQEESQVSFTLDEDLRGLRNTVIGVTDQVAGQIAVNLQDLAATQVGIIQVNARTFATDNEFRNNAISNQILDTNDYEFITFTPTAVNDLPDSVAVGETVSFEIVGDLTIRDITQEVTFTVTVTAVTEERLEGTASTQVLRGDYNLTIPEVPGVANVTDEVLLELTLVANAIQ